MVIKHQDWMVSLWPFGRNRGSSLKFRLWSSLRNFLNMADL